MKKSIIIIAILTSIIATIFGIPQEVAKATATKIYCAVSPSDCPEAK